MGRLRDVFTGGASRSSEHLADDAFASERLEMVREQIASRDVMDAGVLAAMRTVPRHQFVPESQRAYAYRDTPLPIGQGQTISQPYIVALMTALARPSASSRVLEIGTGCGYQTAILAELVEHVYSIELEASLAASARVRLHEMGYDNVTIAGRDGHAGWPEHAPFDAIIVTAAPSTVPCTLLAQLRTGGRLVIPVGPELATQDLQVIEKKASGECSVQSITPVRFVPMRTSR